MYAHTLNGRKATFTAASMSHYTASLYLSGSGYDQQTCDLYLPHRHRSTPAVRKLRRAGIEAYELKGGMLNWWRLHLPTEQS